MLDIRLFNTSLKISWIGKLFSKNTKWKLTIKQICPPMINILENGPQYIDILRKNNDNDFWNDTLACFRLFSERFVFNSWQKFTSQSFLYNKSIRIDNRIIDYDIFRTNRIFLIHHLKSNEHFMSFAEFSQAYPNSNINFMLFNSVISAVKKYEKKCSITYEKKEQLEN